MEVQLLSTIAMVLLSLSSGMSTGNAEDSSSDKQQASDYNNLMFIMQSQIDEMQLLRQEVTDLSNQQQHTTAACNGRFDLNMTDWMTGTSGSSVYVRWGRDECPATADKVYEGFAAGSHQDLGGGTNYLCMTNEPIYDQATSTDEYRRTNLYGVDIESEDFPPFADLYEQDPPCVVCEASGRSIILMVPGRNICPTGWTREYYGYLMTSHANQRRSEFVCVDHQSEGRSETAGENYGQNLFAVQGTCSNGGGGIPCGPYEAGKELTCAICTK